MSTPSLLQRSFIPTYLLLISAIILNHIYSTYAKMNTATEMEHFWLIAFIWLAIKLAPLLLPIKGILNLQHRALGWLGFIILFYFCFHFVHMYEVFPINWGLHMPVNLLYCLIFIQILAIGKSRKKPK